MVKMNQGTKERLSLVINASKHVFHWGFIPVVLYLDSLREMEKIGDPANASVSDRSKLIGEEAINRFVEMLDDFELIETTELYHENERETIQDIHFVSDLEEEEHTSAGPSDSGEDFYPSPCRRKTYSTVPFDTKIKVVNLAKAHPNWSLSTLQNMGSTRLTHKGQIAAWEEDIERGGTRYDKLEQINKWVLDRFNEARRRNELVTTRNLQEWALSAAYQHISQDFKFTAGEHWVRNFKHEFKICQRKVTKYVSSKEQTSLEEILQAAEFFQKQCSQLIPHYDPDYIINTDQTGCAYRLDVKRTLTKKGEKIVHLAIGDINKVSHSYTAQYSITASGKLLPEVFICMREPEGKFGPRVGETVRKLENDYKNIVVTCSKSGKLTTTLFEQFLDKIIKPYVRSNKFLLLLDSWGGQTNSSIYDAKFMDEENTPTCTLKIIPPKCTPLCQPCDVYFYRQVKQFIARLQNSTYLLEQKKEITSRDDCVKIHSLVHNQLSAPVFRDMLQYAWYASKLVASRNVFRNVREVCFPSDLYCWKCECGQSSFIICSWCNRRCCFCCFYDAYHPSVCRRIPLDSNE